MVLVVVLAVLVVAVIVHSRSRSQVADLPVTGDPSGQSRGHVDGTGPGTDPTTSVSLWSKPSTTTGCDNSPCRPGTKAVQQVAPKTIVTVSCVINGQQLRNGIPGGDGFYEDDRWLRVVAVDGEPVTRDDLPYLSNVWFVRSSLPVSVPRLLTR